MNETMQAVFTLSDSAFSRGVDRILDRLDQLEQKSQQVGRRIESSFNDPLSSLTKLAGGIFTVDKAFDLLKQGLKVISDFERMDAALSAVSSSSIDYARTQSFLLNLSDSLGVSYGVLEASYKDLKAATNDTNLEGIQTEKIFTALVHAGAAMKLTNEQMAGSLRAVTQMLSTGTVQADELKNELGNHLPGALKHMAAALKVSTGELMKMLEAGEVMAEDAVPKLAAQLEKTFGPQAQANVDSMAGGWTRATDQLKLFVSEFAKTNGIDTFFSKIGNGIADTIRGFRNAQKGTIQVELDDFYALPADKQKERMDQLGKMILARQKTVDRLAGEAPTDENLEKESTLEKQLVGMRRLYGEMFMAVREGERKIKGQIGSGVKNDPAAYLDKLKDHYDGLIKQRQGLLASGQAVPISLTAAIKADAEKLLRAGVIKPKKDPNQGSGLVGISEFNSKLLNELKQQAQDFPLTDPEAFAEGGLPDYLTRSIALLERLNKESDKVLKRYDTSDLKLMQPKGESAISVISSGGDERRGRFTEGMNARMGEVGQFGTVNFYQQQIQKIQERLNKVSVYGKFTIPQSDIDLVRQYQARINSVEMAWNQVLNPVDALSQRIDQINSQTANLTLSGLKVPQQTLDELANLYSQLRKIQDVTNSTEKQAIGQSILNDMARQKPNEKWFSITGVIDSWSSQAKERLAEMQDMLIKNAKEMTAAVQRTFINSAPSATQAMGEFVDGLLKGTENIGDLKSTVMGAVAEMLSSLANALALSGAALLLGGSPQGALQLAASVGLHAAASAARSSAKSSSNPVKMAKGGTLYKSTQVEAGEYPGAARNPELITPVNKGAELIAKYMTQMGGFGGANIPSVIRLTAAGDELQAVLDWRNRSKQSLG